MAVLKLKITSGRPTAQLQKLEIPGGKHESAQKVINFINSLCSGTELAMSAGNPPSMVISVQESEVRATGTLTGTSVVATETFSINGVTFTGIASGATGNQFNIGVSDTATATNMASAINGSVTALVSGYVTATSALNVVTITSTQYGIGGNQTTIASGQGTIVASGARLTGGAPDASQLTLNF